MDLVHCELTRSGTRIRLQDQPARLLALLVERSGTLVTRAEIQSALWSDGQFVEFEHAINTAIKKIREVLEDNKEAPRFLETLPRKGYRFIASVEFDVNTEQHIETPAAPASQPAPPVAEFTLPLSRRRAQFLFLLTQIPYVVTYVAFFYHWDHFDLAEAVMRTFSIVPIGVSLSVLRVVALFGFTIRVYLIGLVAWGHPAAADRYRRIFPGVALLDAVWAATPLLVQPAVGSAVAIAGLVLMAWLVFGQRTVMASLAPVSH
jgi:DNA-binding winged helix-turn-helix (wHTH) protein